MTGAVEFRSASWFNEKNIERTLGFLGDREIPLVMVDGPQGFKSSVPPVVAATSPDLAIVRFHGRRTATWEAKGIKTVERFRYLYDEDELADWVAAGPRDRRRRPRTPTSCSTTATRTTARRTRSSSPNCSWTWRPDDEGRGDRHRRAGPATTTAGTRSRRGSARRT